MPCTCELSEFRRRRGALAVSSFSSMMLNLTFSVTGPFLAEHAETHWHASPFQVSALFSMSTLATMIFCPVCVVLCKEFGRNSTCFAGLAGMAAMTILFGFVTEVYSGIIVRFVQGASGAMVAVASLALLSQQSRDLSEDLAIKEFFTGIGLIVGPVIGGVAYEYCGFLWTNVIQGLCCLVSLLVALALLPPEQTQIRNPCRPASRRKDTKPSSAAVDSGATAVSLQEALLQVEDPPSCGQEPVPTVLSLVVIVCTTCVSLSYMTLAFLGPSLAKHLELSLGVNSAGSGLLLSLGAVSNVLLGCPSAMLLSRSHRLGAKGTLVAGLGSICVGFVLLPGAPFAFSPYGYPRALSWLCSVLGMCLIGLGVSFEMVPTLPAMRTSLGPNGYLADDTLSSLFFCALTAGATLGPLLSSLLASIVPETEAPSCAGEDCDSPFAWSATVLASFLFVIALVAYVVLPYMPMNLEEAYACGDIDELESSTVDDSIDFPEDGLHSPEACSQNGTLEEPLLQPEDV